ncbi:MAG: nucleoside kinase, partial [Bacteroidales bacterium]|nr:nucleoside kinase [Bacteroidales bacterium]
MPDRKDPTKLAERIEMPRAFEAFSENVRWNVIMGLKNVGAVNLACKNGMASELIQISEALQEKKIVKIAEEINSRY